MNKESLGKKSDEDLMGIYQMGNVLAFEILFERHSGRVQGYLGKKIASQKDVQDILQETFFKLHRSRHQYNSALPFSPWLFSIARSVLLDHIKKSRGEAARLLIFSSESEGSNEPALNSASEAALLARLPANQREAVGLRVFDEATFDEIANRLSTSPENARQLVSRGLKKLKSILGSRKEKL